MANDLISREAVFKAIHDLQTAFGWINSMHEMDIHKKLLKIPVVDAVPVKHGKWIPNGDDDMDAGMWHCSECGHEIYSDLALIEEIQEQGYALYCEHCGAEMRGAE